MRKLKYFLKSLVKYNLRGTAWVSFNEILEGQKKGADIWGTDYPIPTSDTLSFKLLKQCGNSETQYVITSIESKILFFIPFHYDEYIIEIPYKKYTNEGFTAAMALKEINAAEKWNHGDEMRPTGFSGTVTFEGCGKKLIYDVGGGDYTWLKRTGM